MRDEMSRQPPDVNQDIRELPAWARRYAQNQTVPVLVFQAVFVVAAAALGGLSYLTGWAYVYHHRVLSLASLVALIGFAAWWVWFSVFGATGLIRQIAWHLTRGSGVASLGRPSFPAARPPGLVGLAFFLCVVASVVLGFMGWVPMRYMQPMSAIYVVPFMIYLSVKQWNTASPFMVLWPALYAVHAVLIVSGVPISRGPLFDMFFTGVGYGSIAALAGHIYSRFALRRLRALAATTETAEQGEGEG
ncbi:MAG: hypothetical protein ABSD48_12710 [Armatimonadota bacterium]